TILPEGGNDEPAPKSVKYGQDRRGESLRRSEGTGQYVRGSQSALACARQGRRGFHVRPDDETDRCAGDAGRGRRVSGMDDATHAKTRGRRTEACRRRSEGHDRVDESVLERVRGQDELGGLFAAPGIQRVRKSTPPSCSDCACWPRCC